MMEWEEFELPQPEELLERPPSRAKVVKTEIEEVEQNNRKDRILHIYAIDQDRPDFILHIRYRISNRKASKFGMFVAKIYELLKNDPDIPKPIKLKDLIGTVFTWVFKERQVGNILTSFWLPEEYHGKEPVTQEEIQKVEEWIAERNALQEFIGEEQ